MNDDDGERCAHVQVVSGRVVRRKYPDFAHAYLAQIDRVDGEQWDIAVASLSDLLELMRDMTPPTATVVVDEDAEDAAMLRALIQGRARLH